MDDSLDRLMYSFVMEDILKGFFVHVPPGYVACVYDLGRGVLKKVLLPGLHLKVPFWQRAKLFNTQTLEYRMTRDFNLQNLKSMGDTPLNAITSDNQNITIEGTILLRLRMIASRFLFQDMVANQRDIVETQIKDELERIFYPRGIRVENVLLSEINKVKGRE